MSRNRANQKRLPGVDGGIPELEQLGFEYAAIRDRRMETLKEEVELKGKIFAAMKKHKKTQYIYQDLMIQIVPGEEKLKVKVAKEDEDEDAA